MRCFSLILSLGLASTVSAQVGFLALPADPAVPSFTPQSFSENGGPFRFHPGTQLIVKSDGGERVIATDVHDWNVTLDGKSVLYSQVHTGGSDIYRVSLAGGDPVRLTNAADEWRPPSGVYPADSDGPVWNTAPCDTPEGIVFTSSRDNIKSPQEGYVAFMLYTMGHDGSNVTKIGHMNLSGALHPSYYKGRIYFATNETQGNRGGRGNGWAIWSIKFDGTDWQPELTVAGRIGSGWHNTTHSSDGTLVADFYYDTRTVGMLDAVPPLPSPDSPFATATKFGNPVSQKNPQVWNGWDRGRASQGNTFNFAFQRVGQFSPLPWAQRGDRENTDGLEPPYYQREVGQPSAALGNSLLLTWTGDLPDRRQFGIYKIPDMAVKYYVPTDRLPPPLSNRPLDYMSKVVDEVDRHEWYPKSIASYQEIYGSPPPAMTPSPKASELPEGTPYGIIGSSNINWREILVRVASTTWAPQEINPADVAGIRILAFNPTQAIQSHASSGNGIGTNPHRGYEGLSSAINERTGYYEPLIPIEADGSFKAAIPADQPWTFQLMNHRGEALATAQTWHQVRPGEKRVDCNGCHAHNKPAPEKFEEQIAGQPGYQFATLKTARTVVYDRDIKPIDERLALGIGSRPFTITGGPKAYESRNWPVLADSRLTDAERRLLAAWADTGFMAASEASVTPESQLGPYADTQPPTLVLTTYTDHTLIGAHDPNSGLMDGSLSVKSEAGEELAAQFTREGDVWRGPPLTGTVTVSVRDNQHATGAEAGNLTQIVRTVTQAAPPPVPDQDAEELARLTARVAELEAQTAADAALIAQLKAKIEAAKAALEK